MNYQPSITEEAGEPAGYKDELLIEGVNPDYVWYEADIIYRDLIERYEPIAYRFAKLVKTIQERHAENVKLALHLSDENKMLKDLLKQLGMRPATRKEKITNPGVYWVLDTNEEKKE